jgi:hypothetical protein
MAERDEVTIHLPVAGDRAFDFVVSAASEHRMAVSRTARGLRISPRWVLGRSYIMRPAFVGSLAPDGSSTVLTGSVGRRGVWFQRIWWAGVGLSWVVALTAWLTAATGLRYASPHSVDASILVTPGILLVVGGLAFRFSRFDSDRQRDRLIAFVRSLPEAT